MQKLIISIIAIFFVCIFCGIVLGQQEILRIRGFGGLNTIDGDFQIKPNEARRAHEVDWSRNIGAISKRRGYATVGTVSGADSLVGIFGAYYSTGEQQLFVVYDRSTGFGHGNVAVTAKGSDDVTSLTIINSTFAIQNKPSFAIFRDNVYIVNGQQKGLIFHAESQVAHQWPPNAPGEPTIIPLDSSGAGELDGEYRYIFRYNDIASGGSSSLFGIVSAAVKVTSGRMLIKDFPHVPYDSTTLVANGGDGKSDSIRVDIFRTKANPGQTGPEDLAYSLVNTLFEVSVADWNGTVYVDSIADGDLGGATPLIKQDFFSNGRVGGFQRSRYGAPTFVSATLGGPAGILLGVPDARDSANGDYAGSVSGWVYATTFVDTLFNMESTLGPFLHIPRSNLDDSITIGLPRVANGFTHMKINIYRAHAMTVTYDTSWVKDSVWESHLIESTGEEWWRWRRRHFPVITPESTIIGDFHLLAQIKAVDSSYTDGTPYDSLYRLQSYRQTAPPVLLDNVFSADDRLFGTVGSRLYFSTLDTGQAFRPFNFISLNANDGDEIVAAYPIRGVIRVLKNRSSFNVWQDANGRWNRREITENVGTLSRNSVIHSLSGYYYLTDQGIVKENEGLFLDRTQSIKLVSNKLKNFTVLPQSTKENVYGFYFDQKAMFSVPYSGLVDTVFVFDEQTQSWSTWGPKMGIGGATLYSTESGVNFRPGDTMYFFSPGESVVKKYPSGEDDAGVVINLKYRSAPFLIDQFTYSVDALGVWGSSSASGDTTSIFLVDDGGTIVSGTTKKFGLDSKYTIRYMPPNRELYFHIQMSAGSPFAGSASIDGFDIYYTNKGITEGK